MSQPARGWTEKPSLAGAGGQAKGQGEARSGQHLQGHGAAGSLGLRVSEAGGAQVWGGAGRPDGAGPGKGLALHPFEPQSYWAAKARFALGEGPWPLLVSGQLPPSPRPQGHWLGPGAVNAVRCTRT